MFPQIPPRLPPAITKSHDVAEVVMARDMQEHDPSGPVALAWQWALTGQGPTPITLMDWNTGLPSRQDMAWQIECPDEWRGQVPWDEIRAARSVLWWLTSDHIKLISRLVRLLGTQLDPDRLTGGGLTHPPLAGQRLDQHEPEPGFLKPGPCAWPGRPRVPVGHLDPQPGPGGL